MRALVTLALLIVLAMLAESSFNPDPVKQQYDSLQFCRNTVVPFNQESRDEVVAYCLGISNAFTTASDFDEGCRLLLQSSNAQDKYNNTFAAFFVAAKQFYSTMCLQEPATAGPLSTSSPTNIPPLDPSLTTTPKPNQTEESNSTDLVKWQYDFLQICRHTVVPYNQENREEVVAYCLGICTEFSTASDFDAGCLKLLRWGYAEALYNNTFASYFIAAKQIFWVICMREPATASPLSTLPPTDTPPVDPSFTPTQKRGPIEELNSKVCGKSEGLQWGDSTRIAGGRNVKDCSVIPWQVYLEVGPYLVVCGGSIISDQHILTAAHCLDEIDSVTEVKVTIAEYNLDMDDAYEDKRAVMNMTIHENYDPNDYRSDIAILTLEKPLRFNNPCVQKICLDPDFDFDGLYCTVSGWGALSASGQSSPILQMVKVKTYKGEKCFEEFNIIGQGYITHEQEKVCAGHLRGGKEFCMGDSGGPLTCLNTRTSTFVQVGVVSYSNGCAWPGFPGVYASVAYFHDWIQKIIG